MTNNIDDYDIAKKIGKLILFILKALFKSVTEVAWGLASIFLMSAVLNYYHDKYGTYISVMNPIFGQLVTYIINNIMLFVIVFFIYSLYINYRSIE